jgi:transcriptional regulator with XRE-family HTH domain
VRSIGNPAHSNREECQTQRRSGVPVRRLLRLLGRKIYVNILYCPDRPVSRCCCSGNGGILGVDPNTVTNWERNRCQPRLYLVTRISGFLGINPLRDSIRGGTLGEKIKAWRRALDVNQKRMALDLGVDPSTLAHWDRGERKPSAKHIEKLQTFLGRGS